MDENNKELNINNNGVNTTTNSSVGTMESPIVSNDGVVSSTDTSSEVVINNVDTANTVVEEVSFNYPEKEIVPVVENTNVVEESSVSVDSSAPAPVVSTTIEEVSVSGTSLDEVETSSNSVFNDKNEEEVVSGSMKEGQEHRADKKGVPYGMLLGFGILIVCAFFIEEIVGFVEDYLLPKDEVVEENNKKDDKETETNKEEQKEEIIPDNNDIVDDNTNNDVVDNNDNSNDLEDDIEIDNDESIDNSFNEGE